MHYTNVIKIRIHTYYFSQINNHTTNKAKTPGNLHQSEENKKIFLEATELQRQHKTSFHLKVKNFGLKDLTTIRNKL